MIGAKLLPYFMRIKCNSLVYICDMKYPIIVITVACLLSSGAYSQILNGGFEG